MAGADRVPVGVVGKPFGLHGEVYVRPDPDVADDFPPGRRYQTPDGARPELVVAASREHAGRLLVRFAGVDDRAAAEALRGVTIALPRAELELDADEFWIGDLLGREVVDDAGTLVGVLEGSLDGTAHDYLVVARADGGEVLIPAVAELVEVTADRIVVHAIPGLLDAER